MSSFFDKITKAVGDITKKVEDSGVIGDLKDLVSGDEASAASAAEATADEAAATGGGSSSDASRGWAGAVERAGLNPMKLLTPRQIGDELELDLDHTYEQLDDEWFGVTWTTKKGGGPFVEARFAHGYSDGSPVDIPGMWQFVTGEDGANQPVHVAGAEAVIDDLDTVYVKTGQSLFYIVSGGLPDGRVARDLHIGAASAVVQALG